MPEGVQEKTSFLLQKIINNPHSHGVRLKKIPGAADEKIRLVKIDQDYECVIVLDEESGVFAFLWIDLHDRALVWAAGRKFAANPRTGIFQVFKKPEVPHYRPPINQGLTNQANPSILTRYVPAPANDPEAGLLDRVGDKDLLSLGLPEELLPLVRSLKTKEDLCLVGPDLPVDSFEILKCLADDCPVEQALRIFGDLFPNEDQGGQTPKSGEITASLKNASGLSNFAVIGGNAELLRIIDAPLEKWRVFLHSAQRKLVSKTFDGPFRVLGGAGTGKTVVAMHRAKWLASQCLGHEKILFTTFTRNLANDIKHNLSKICSPEEMKRIEVCNFDLWVNKYMNHRQYDLRVVYGHDLTELWDKAISLASETNEFDRTFYEQEWNKVVTVQRAFTKKRYLAASRLGRGTPVDRKKRILIWKVFKEFINQMWVTKKRDINMAICECSVISEKVSKFPLYKSIVIDEAQDFGLNELAFLRKIAGPERPNDLFIVGDAHQRIYDKRAVLSKCGIDVTGRDGYLCLNYRTTEQIREVSLRLLKDTHTDDLDDGRDAKYRCQSLTSGDGPIIKRFESRAREADFIVSEIKKLQRSKVELKSLCLVARTNALLNDYRARLQDAGLPVYDLKLEDFDDQSQDGVRLGTLHRVKGLEFRVVFIAAVNDKILPLTAAITKGDAVHRQERLTAEKRLLYVAMTRAQKAVYLTSHGQPSPFLQDLE
ncbi:MAG: UvrD-helicase domain-containing protein [Deltaproteobacteria bacterium]|nr:UvrD-helicase domain-containing protein [Deltaproteobacteria bacterium]